ncbi:MAG: hypothetical protein ACRDEA_22205, partial [Microcystaceae cyanobacterium]
MGTFPGLTANVRGYANDAVAEDPPGTFKSGKFRAWGGVNVNLASGSATSKVTITTVANPASKTIKVDVHRDFGDEGVLAAAEDPFTFSPEPFSRDLELIDTISALDILTLPGETGTVHESTAVALGSTKLPIYDLSLSASGGSVPTILLNVFPAAISQGWDQPALLATLKSLLKPQGSG